MTPKVMRISSVTAAMNCNVWDVTEQLQSVIRSGATPRREALANRFKMSREVLTEPGGAPGSVHVEVVLGERSANALIAPATSAEVRTYLPGVIEVSITETSAIASVRPWGVSGLACSVT